MPSERRPRFITIAGVHVRLLAGLAIWLSGWGFPASAQTWPVNHWHVDDGLPYGGVTAIAQTPEGYLWVGPWRGCVKAGLKP